VVSVLSLNCPVCGAPFSPGADRCGYCGSILVLNTDHPRIDPRSLNRAVVDQHIQEYRDLLRQDPYSVKAHYGLGVAYFNLGLTEAAIDSLERACRITPENPHIHTQLAVAWREEAATGDSRAQEEIRDHIQYALRLEPENIEALILASELAAGDHDIETAVMFSERAWQRAPDRAQELHGRLLTDWIRWKSQRGEATGADYDRVARFSPDLERQIRHNALGASVPRSSVSAWQATPSVTPSPKPAGTIVAVRNALLGGIGVSLVSCCVLAYATEDVASGTSASAWLGFVYLLLFVLPVFLAIRAWNSTRKKDPSA
jgi:hypothetical protein